MASYSQAVLRDALTYHDVTSGLRLGAGHVPEPGFPHGRLSLLQLPQSGYSYSTAQTALLIAPSALFLLLFPFWSLRLRGANLKALPNYTGAFKAVIDPRPEPQLVANLLTSRVTTTLASDCGHRCRQPRCPGPLSDIPSAPEWSYHRGEHRVFRRGNCPMSAQLPRAWAFCPALESAPVLPSGLCGMRGHPPEILL